METITLNLEDYLSEEEIKLFEEEQKLFCECDYLTNHPEESAKYVEAGYEVEGVGVCHNHGWICPGCGKFVQLG